MKTLVIFILIQTLLQTVFPLNIRRRSPNTADEKQFTTSELRTYLQDTKQYSEHVFIAPEATFQNETLVSIVLPINGANVRMNLVPAADDLLPPQVQNTKCHYRSITPNIFAAISNCDKLYRGVILMDDGIFILDPSPSTVSQSPFSRIRRDYRHVIFKRNAPESFCGINTNDALNDQRRLKDDPGVEESVVPTSRLSKQSDVTVELAVFVDAELWRKYQVDHGGYADSQLQDFVTALLNNMQILYHHPTITPSVNFKVVRYEVLKSQPADFYATSDAQGYLDSFCSYQSRVPNRNWDHSLLLTGYDLVRFGNDHSISGIARLRGACDSYNACTVAEGLDFTATFIATHEIGHSLGMRHDEPYCSSDFIMSGSLGSGKVSWSTCSVTDFQKNMEKLDQSGKNCLRQTGSEYAALTVDGNNLPGQRFGADQQCSMMHGAGYHQIKPYAGIDANICYMMWCSLQKYGKILTSHPALEGTNCDSGKYCIRGECTSYGGAAPVQPQIIDGSWSAWGSVDCSNCKCTPVIGGVGVLKSVRACTSPAPANGGKDCSGDRVRGIMCSSSCAVATHTIDAYMKAVCTNRKTEKNDQELTGTGTQLTTFDARACKVFCDIQTSSGQKSFRSFGDILPDGTACGTGKYCVDGECLSLQCSNTLLLSSQSSYCLPGSETCLRANAGPPPAPSASWTEWSAWSTCSATCGSGTIIRRRSCSGSTCVGALEETSTCTIAACPTAATITQGVWSYWSQWSSFTCSNVTAGSVTCGRGQRKKARSCETRNCAARWEERMEPCGVEFCPWSEWSHCSVTCGQGRRTRYRHCPGGYCKSSDGFASNHTEICKLSVCVNKQTNTWLQWTSWSACTVTCGRGTRSRNRYCSPTPDGCPGSKDESDQCENTGCVSNSGSRWYEWSDWSTCSQSCNSGTQTRNRQCSGSNCDGASSETTTCNAQLCGNDVLADDVGIGQWSQWSEWTQCTETCGKGIQYRHRSCRRGVCDGRRRDEQSCYVALCAQWGGWSLWSSCDEGRTEKKRIRNCYGSGSCLGNKDEIKPC